MVTYDETFLESQPTGSLAQRFERAMAEALRKHERPYRPKPPTPVSPVTFQRMVDLGLIDEHGCELPPPRRR